ncbi:MAG: DUF4363 family protein [Clostridia bacterium]|nr:DUF4363 family protein [Clostridia bacterium]
MLKEAVICIVIIIGILGLEFYTQNFTSKSVKEITEIFDKIEERLEENNVEDAKNEIKKISRKWEENQKKLAYYIEHDELEKVHTAIVLMKSYTETEDFSSAMASLKEGKFVIEHIHEKNSFNLQNIF